jgi:hypothetical protein
MILCVFLISCDNGSTNNENDAEGNHKQDDETIVLPFSDEEETFPDNGKLV